MRGLLARHLREGGYDVRRAADAVAAGFAVLAALPGLIVFDAQTHELEWLRFCAMLRADRSIPRIPALFLSAEEDGMQRALRVGAAGWLTTPVVKDRLLTAVGLLLRRQAALAAEASRTQPALQHAAR
jgi:DNA-binding response OmpR family regulator